MVEQVSTLRPHVDPLPQHEADDLGDFRAGQPVRSISAEEVEGARVAFFELERGARRTGLCCRLLRCFEAMRNVHVQHAPQNINSTWA